MSVVNDRQSTGDDAAAVEDGGDALQPAADGSVAFTLRAADQPAACGACSCIAGRAGEKLGVCIFFEPTQKIDLGPP